VEPVDSQFENHRRRWGELRILLGKRIAIVLQEVGLLRRFLFMRLAKRTDDC